MKKLTRAFVGDIERIYGSVSQPEAIQSPNEPSGGTYESLIKRGLWYETRRLIGSSVKP